MQSATGSRRRRRARILVVRAPPEVCLQPRRGVVVKPRVSVPANPGEPRGRTPTWGNGANRLVVFGSPHRPRVREYAHPGLYYDAPPGLKTTPTTPGGLPHRRKRSARLATPRACYTARCTPGTDGRSPCRWEGSAHVTLRARVDRPDPGRAGADPDRGRAGGEQGLPGPHAHLDSHGHRGPVAGRGRRPGRLPAVERTRRAHAARLRQRHPLGGRRRLVDRPPQADALPRRRRPRLLCL